MLFPGLLLVGAVDACTGDGLVKIHLGAVKIGAVHAVKADGSAHGKAAA